MGAFPLNASTSMRPMCARSTALTVPLALKRYEKIVAGIGLGIVCFVVVAALGCIVYEVVKAHGNLSTALADAKTDLAKAEATAESLVSAAKKAV
jgi:hypothetical protein